MPLSSNTTDRSTASSYIDERVQVTLDRVDWDTLLAITSRTLSFDNMRWGSHTSGSYNLVRFVHHNEDEVPVAVVRVPLLPEGELTPEFIQSMEIRYKSETATMTYISTHTAIPVPKVFDSSVSFEGSSVCTPFMILERVDGVSLTSLWDDMPDDARDIVLRQVVKIYLELYSHKFPGIGALMKSGINEWRVEPFSTIAGVNKSRYTKDALNRVFVSGLDFWANRATARMQKVADQYFGSLGSAQEYGELWFLRSMIPTFIDPNLDLRGFPLAPADFDAQNIFISFPDGPGSPRITGVIDWELTTTECTSVFAQYPFFIVDHPYFDEDDPVRARNKRDQEVFVRLMRDEEIPLNPSTPLTKAFSQCRVIYLLKQCFTDSILSPRCNDELQSLVFGSTEDVEGAMIWHLLDSGILHNQFKQWRIENEVFEEAASIHSELKCPLLCREKFIDFTRTHRDTFPSGGKVEAWLCTLPVQTNDTLGIGI